jgi:hypothetical protein
MAAVEALGADPQREGGGAAGEVDVDPARDHPTAEDREAEGGEGDGATLQGDLGLHVARIEATGAEPAQVERAAPREGVDRRRRAALAACAARARERVEVDHVAAQIEGEGARGREPAEVDGARHPAEGARHGQVGEVEVRRGERRRVSAERDAGAHARAGERRRGSAEGRHRARQRGEVELADRGVDGQGVGGGVVARVPGDRGAREREARLAHGRHRARPLHAGVRRER